MNLPTLIVLLVIAAALFLVLWLPRRGGKKQNRCSHGCCSGCGLSDACRSAKSKA